MTGKIEIAPAHHMEQDYALLRLEVGMARTHAMTMLRERYAALETDVSEAFDKMEASGALEELVKSNAEKEINAAVRSAIKGQVENYYSYGDGRRTVDKVIKETLSDHMTESYLRTKIKEQILNDLMGVK